MPIPYNRSDRCQLVTGNNKGSENDRRDWIFCANSFGICVQFRKNFDFNNASIPSPIEQSSDLLLCLGIKITYSENNKYSSRRMYYIIVFIINVFAIGAIYKYIYINNCFSCYSVFIISAQNNKREQITTRTPTRDPSDVKILV